MCTLAAFRIALVMLAASWLLEEVSGLDMLLLHIFPSLLCEAKITGINWIVGSF